MSQRVGVVCLGAMLIAAAGCVSDLFLGSSANPIGKRQVVAGSVAVVSGVIQQKLCDRGVAVLEKHQDDGVLLVGTTGAGKMFSLRLRNETAEGGPRTSIVVLWPGDADEPFWRIVVQELTAENTEHR